MTPRHKRVSSSGVPGAISGKSDGSGVLMRSNVSISWKPIKSAVLLAFALSAIWVEPARAQTKDGQQQDIQQLKDKLQQLDQMMEEVKAEITAMELRGQQHAPGSAATPGPAQAK